MYTVLVFLIFGLFAAMLFLNVYFRVKVFKVYKKLVQNRVEFDASHIFNRQKMEAEIYPRYPQHKEDIATFVQHMQYSIRMATVLTTIITMLGAVIMYFR
ncbi:MAG: hypothetical protein AB8G15_18635 [Saprospiraceae bacterium]